MSNPQQQHAVISALAQNQSLLSVVVPILEKHVTQLAKVAFAQGLILHSAVVLISQTSVIQNVINYVSMYHMHVMKQSPLGFVFCVWK
jgi:hypothetical protein